jgi:hypothetical protein
MTVELSSLANRTPFLSCLPPDAMSLHRLGCKHRLRRQSLGSLSSQAPGPISHAKLMPRPPSAAPEPKVSGCSGVA